MAAPDARHADQGRCRSLNCEFMFQEGPGSTGCRLTPRPTAVSTCAAITYAIAQSRKLGRRQKPDMRVPLAARSVGGR